VLSRYPKLLGLVPIVKACCSDDKTDNESSQDIQVSYSKENPKQCVIMKLPWRHRRIKEMMESIDELKRCGEKSNPRGSAGAAPRSRRRIPSPKKNQKNPPTKLAKESQMKPPAKLTKACYKSEWLASCRPQRVAAMKMQSKPDVKALIKELDHILRNKQASASSGGSAGKELEGGISFGGSSGHWRRIGRTRVVPEGAAGGQEGPAECQGGSGGCAAGGLRNWADAGAVKSGWCYREWKSAGIRGCRNSMGAGRSCREELRGGAARRG
ncbi:hypothetical protein VP01_5654g3, partial [Puccinia sorghi]